MFETLDTKNCDVVENYKRILSLLLPISIVAAVYFEAVTHCWQLQHRSKATQKIFRIAVYFEAVTHCWQLQHRSKATQKIFRIA
jgi:hypothetical protein